jgi:hypothetical protein
VSSLYSLGMILKNEAISRWGSDAKLHWRMGSGVASDILDQLKSLSLWRNRNTPGPLPCSVDSTLRSCLTSSASRLPSRRNTTL